MKTKLLRKIRKRYSIFDYRVKERIFVGEYHVLDHKKKVIIKYITIQDIFELMDIDYNKLDKLRQYNRGLRKLNNGNKTSTIKA